ncbi:hypothetical protein KKH43_05180 [Patescibacteria group bacterium]|nr:hypothetical protein [Patescibacteria group bacterium]
MIITANITVKQLNLLLEMSQNEAKELANKANVSFFPTGLSVVKDYTHQEMA